MRVYTLYISNHSGETKLHADIDVQRSGQGIVCVN